MDLVPFFENRYNISIALFIQQSGKLGWVVRFLTGAITYYNRVAGKLRFFMALSIRIAAKGKGMLVGSQGWIIIDLFQGANHRQTYYPAWNMPQCQKKLLTYNQALKMQFRPVQP